MGTPTPTPTPAATQGSKPLEAKDSTAAAVAQTPADAPKPATPAAAKAKAEPCFALMAINGTILPGQMFRPDNKAQRDELDTLHAVRDLTEAEAALFEKLEAGGAASDDDDLG